MTIETVRDVLATRPFEPFKMQLADGTTVDIAHPDMDAFHPSSPRTLHVALPDGRFKKLDLLLVAAIHVASGAK